jgi:F-type H+-transporting ATPase subunit b
MISINETLIIQIIHFLILVFILNRLMFRPILAAIDKRSKYIEDSKKEIVDIENETTELFDKCVSMEKGARTDAGNESSRLKKEALETSENIFNDSREEVSSIREKVKKEIDEQLKRAKQSLQSEAVSLADTITEKVMGRRIGN